MSQEFTDPDLCKARKIAKRCRDELMTATMNWATIEGLNLVDERLKVELGQRNAWQPVKFGARGLVRDVIMALMRVTEGKGQGAKGDFESLGRFVALIHGKDAQLLAGSNDSALTKEAIAYVRDRQVANWQTKIPPGVTTISDILQHRIIFRSLRDAVIAHGKDFSSEDFKIDFKADIPHLRTFIVATRKVADAACVACGLESEDFEAHEIQALEEAQRFWSIVLAGTAATSPAPRR